MKVITTLVSAALLAATVITAQQPTITTVAPAPTPTAQPTWSNCASNPILSLTSFSVSPVPLCHGKPVEITATGSLSKPIESGAFVSIAATLLGRRVYADSFDLCEVLAAAGTPCPVADITSLTFTSVVDERIPIGYPLNMKIEIINGDGGIILCQASPVVASTCGNPPYTRPPITTTTTTPPPTPTPVPGVWAPCDGPQNMVISDFSVTPNAWCRGMPVCMTITGTLKSNITWATSATLYGKSWSPDFNPYNTWDFYENLVEQGYAHRIPAGPITFHACSNINGYTPDQPGTWEIRLVYHDLPPNQQWNNIFCFRATNQFQIPNCSN